MKTKSRSPLFNLVIAFLLSTIIAICLYLIFKVYIGRWSIATFLLIYSIISFANKAEYQGEKVDKYNKDWPVSGPIGKLGGNALMISFYGTSILSILNPFQFIQLLNQSIGNFILGSDKSQLIDNAHDYYSETDYILPFEKNTEWLVYNGGINKSTSHSWDIIAQRFAYDFVIADNNYGRHLNRGTKVDDYFCYNQNITSVADGTVVKVVNNIGTAPFVGYGILDVFARNFIGNHVVIKHKVNEYSLYAHLIKGSINVEKGDAILQGESFGKCGHTGYSTEPHLHFQLQDKADFFFAKGLPIRFNHLKINGELTDQSYISAADRVIRT